MQSVCFESRVASTALLQPIPNIANVQFNGERHRFLVMEANDAAPGTTAAEPAAARQSTLPGRTVRRIQEFIEANLSSRLSLHAIAKVSGYSPAYFLRMYHASTGRTPHQYLIERRVRRAQQFIRQGGARLIDVADSCGFSSQSHMTSVFRKQTGVTPMEYRRNIC